jgi:hypothetical protein
MKLMYALLATIALATTAACATQASPPPPTGPSPSETAAYQQLDQETANGPAPQAQSAGPNQ